MIKLLKFLFTGSWHEHKWIIIKEKKFEYRDALITNYHLRCEGCGELKRERLVDH